jgi:glycosyltransferase involved in cell wall biosynthesis
MTFADASGSEGDPVMPLVPSQSDTVSVVIPAWNVEAYIARAIDSVLAQTRAPDEILVVDDGSTDTTPRIVRRYEPRVRYLCQPQTGAAEARNRGIAEASGRWIAFLDADDQWLPEKLSRQMELLARNPDLVWSYSNYFIHPAGSDRQMLSHTSQQAVDLLAGKDFFDDYLAAYAAGAPTTSTTMIVRRDILQAVGMFQPGRRWAQDADLALRIAYPNPKVGYVSQPLSIYQAGRSDSITLRNRTDIPLRCDFLLRHLDLSRQAGRADGFVACARHLLSRWINEIGKDPAANLSPFLEKLLQLLSTSQKVNLYLRKIPGLSRIRNLISEGRQAVKSSVKRVIRRFRKKSYDPREYWSQRHNRFGLSVRGVGNCSLSENENSDVYRQARQVFLDYCRSIGISFQGASVLDIGCGNGYYTEVCSELGVTDYTGLDITDTLFPSLRYRFPSYRFCQLDITSQSPDSSYQIILMIDVTEHIVDDGKFSAAMQMIREHMNDNGVFLVTSWLISQRIQRQPHETARPLEFYRREFPDQEFLEPVAFRDKFLFAIRGKPGRK